MQLSLSLSLSLQHTSKRHYHVSSLLLLLFAGGTKQESNNVDAADVQCYLGLRCQFEDPENCDMTRAIDHYGRAAAQGHMFSMLILHWCYLGGVGVEKNYRMSDEIKTQFQQCLENGNDNNDASRDNALSFKFLQQMTGGVDCHDTNQSPPLLQYLMAMCFYFGLGVEQCQKEAVKWLKLAADRGCIAAQNDLGHCYGAGEGVEHNVEEAVRWYRLSAEEGDATAQFYMGTYYYTGSGVEFSYEEAVKWYRLSAEQGHTLAQHMLGFCYQHGQGVEQSDEEAAKWFELAEQ